MGNNAEHFAGIQANNIHCSPQVDRKSYFVVEGGQVSVTRFTFGKSPLAVASHLLLLDTTEPGLRE